MTWRPVVTRSECRPCEHCGEEVCPLCNDHYIDCLCPGPHQDDLYEYREKDGRLEARPLNPDPENGIGETP